MKIQIFARLTKKRPMCHTLSNTNTNALYLICFYWNLIIFLAQLFWIYSYIDHYVYEMVWERWRAIRYTNERKCRLKYINSCLCLLKVEKWDIGEREREREIFNCTDGESQRNESCKCLTFFVETHRFAYLKKNMNAMPMTLV